MEATLVPNFKSNEQLLGVTNEGNKLDAKLNPIKTPTTLINWACINICHIQHVLLIPSPTHKQQKWNHMMNLKIVAYTSHLVSPNG
jgi:hypothetical protein